MYTFIVRLMKKIFPPKPHQHMFSPMDCINLKTEPKCMGCGMELKDCE